MSFSFRERKTLPGPGNCLWKSFLCPPNNHSKVTNTINQKKKKKIQIGFSSVVVAAVVSNVKCNTIFVHFRSFFFLAH